MADPQSTASSGADPKLAGMIYNPDVGYLNSQASRSIDSPTYSSGTAPTPSTVKCPTDTVLKRVYFDLVLSTQVTYAAGSPVTSEQGVFDRICPSITIDVNGNRLIKGIRPHLSRLFNIMMGGNLPRRAYQTSASAFTTARASLEWMAGTVAYPATTQYFIFNEGFSVWFENVLGYGGSRFASELDIRDVASCNFTFNFAALSNLQRDGVGATVTYSTSPTVTITPFIIENRARPRPQAGQVLYDYVESYISDQVSAQSVARQIQLQTGNYLMALGLYCNNGDTNKSPRENLVTQLSLKINGSTAIQGPVSHKVLQDDSISRMGAWDLMGLADINATIASTADAHPLKGYALMNLVRNGDWNTALNTSVGAGVSTVKLEYTTPASSGNDAATYTNPLQLWVHTHEMRPYAYTR